jgi:hypothetical protein
MAARVVVALLGMHPEVAEDLERICHRESRCGTHEGVHVRDAYLGPESYYGHVNLGHLDPECQPLGDMLWATRGAFGLNAADHWQYMWPCYQASAFDSHWETPPMRLLPSRRRTDAIAPLAGGTRATFRKDGVGAGWVSPMSGQGSLRDTQVWSSHDPGHRLSATTVKGLLRSDAMAQRICWREPQDAMRESFELRGEVSGVPLVVVRVVHGQEGH